MSEHLPMRWDPYTDPPELEPEMPEIEHQSSREGMTGVNYTFGLRPEFRSCDALDAPWLLPLGGVVVHAADNVADCFVERECDDDALILARAAEFEAAELCPGGSVVAARCAGCRRPLGLCEVTYLVEHEDGADEWCEECDADLPRTLRPSLGFVPALLRSVNAGETSPPALREVKA